MPQMLKLLVIIAAGLALQACTTTKNTIEDLLGRNQGFSTLDTNSDGVLSETEAQALPGLAASFEQVDTNNDRNINRNEFRAANSNVVPVAFGDLDLNNDGVLSRREAEASRRSLRDTFDQVDADQDGNVSNAEYQAATLNLLKNVNFEDVDSDGDGVLDRREVGQHPVVDAHFDTIDVNNDLLIGPEEFEWAKR